MAVRNFDGAADLIVCSIGGLASVDGGANTYAALIKVTTTKDQGIMNVHDSAATQHQGLVLLSVSGDIGYQSGLGGQDIALAVPTATWGVAVVTKASGTSTPRGHWCVLGGANTHTNAGGTVQDYGANDLAGGSVRFGGAGFGDYDGRIAAAGILNSVLSDANIESLKTSWANWVALFTGANAALYRFDQASTSDPVNDQTGNGANQTSLTGTTVVTGDDPPGFDWGAADASYRPGPLSVVRYKIPALRGLRTFTSELTTVPPAASGANSGEQRVSGFTTGVKGAVGAEASEQRSSGTTAAAKQTSGATASGQHTSGQAGGAKGATGATVGQQRSAGLAVRGTPPAGPTVGMQRVTGLSTGRKGAADAAAGPQRTSGLAGGVHRAVGAASGQQRTAGTSAAAKQAKGATSGQVRSSGMVVVTLTPSPRWVEHAGAGVGLIDASGAGASLEDGTGSGVLVLDRVDGGTSLEDGTGGGTGIIEGSGGV